MIKSHEPKDIGTRTHTQLPYFFIVQRCSFQVQHLIWSTPAWCCKKLTFGEGIWLAQGHTALPTSKASSSNPEACAVQSQHTHSCVWRARLAGFETEHVHLWKGLICRTSTEGLNHPVSVRGRVVGVILHLDMVTVLALTFIGLGYPKVSLNGIHAKGLDFQHLSSCLGVVLKTYFYRDICLREIHPLPVSILYRCS